GGEKTEPSPVLFPTSISPSRPCHFSSLSKQEQFPGGKDEQQQHKQNKQKQQQQQQQQYATKGGERAGMVRCRSVEEEESVMTVARIQTKIDVEEDEIDEEEKTNVWSCGEDKVPSPRIMEAIVDKGNFFIPPGIALNALTVTLPEETVDVVASRAGGRSTGARRRGSVPSSTWPLNPSKISASTPALAGGSQLEGKRWGSGTSFSAAQAGAVYQRQDIPPLLSVSPLRRKSSAVPSTSAKTPAAQPGLDTTSGKAEQGNALDNTTTAAAAARRNSIGMAEGINRSASKAALSTALETHEGEITAVATVAAASLQQQTQKQKQELRQLHERKHQRGQGHQLLQMPLSSLLSSPALLCRTHSTHQT
ncbi:unnamed protein product, partial [Pylaiella littoralis]